MNLEQMKRLNQSMQDVNEGKSNSSISLEEADNINRQAVAEANAKNYGRAFDLYLKAAKAGSVWAMRNLGYVYQNGSGTQKDDRSAFEWFKKAAEHADINLEAATDAMFEVGIYYYRGEITPKDVVKSFSWCKKAAENGVVNAMNWVGEFYRDGEGVMQDRKKAIEWFKKSAEAGNEYAMLNLGAMYEPSDDLKSICNASMTDINYALSWYQKAANLDNVEAMYRLGRVFHIKFKKYIFIDSNKYQKGKMDCYMMMRGCYEKAAANGHDGAKNALYELDKESDSCFITTAVCDNFGKDDDCYELTTFRNFRDNWLVNQSDGKYLIDKYYEIAPKIVSKINQLNNSNEIYKSIWCEYLKPCLNFIEAEKYQDCKNLYIKMVNSLQKSFLR